MLRKNPWEHLEVEDNEELWIVSYADMVTLLFGFFVILYSFSTLDEKKFDQMGEKLASAFKAPEEKDKKDSAEAGISNEARQIRALQLLVAMLNMGENVDDAVKKIEAAASSGAQNQDQEKMVKDLIKKESIDADVLRMSTGKKREDVLVELSLADTALFQSGRAELSSDAKQKLRRLGSELALAPSVASVEVEGHTDASPLPGKSMFQNNFALSSTRAGAVAEELIKGGMDAKLFSVKGYGNLRPLVPERDARGRAIQANMAKNRRVQIVLRKVPPSDAH